MVLIVLPYLFLILMLKACHRTSFTEMVSVAHSKSPASWCQLAPANYRAGSKGFVLSRILSLGGYSEGTGPCGPDELEGGDGTVFLR